MTNTAVYQSNAPTYQFKFLSYIITFFSATWLVSCIAAVKLVSVYGFTLTGGFIVFPFTSLVSSIIAEIYGYKNARQAIWSGFLLNFTFIFFIYIVSLMPASPYWNLQYEFNKILMPSLRITCASVFSFMASFFLNAFVMAKMKLKNHGYSLQKRIIFSNLISITVDIFLFIFIAFLGTMSAKLLMNLLAAAYIKKLMCELISLPLIWYLIDNLKAHEGVEIFDIETNFSPFSMDNIYSISAYKTTNKYKIT